MTTLRELADKLEGLEKAATPGEWFVAHDDRPGMEWNNHIYSDPDNAVCFMTHSGTPDNTQQEAAAELIPALRNASPQIIQSLRRLAALEQAMDEFANERITQRITLLAREIEKGTGNG